MKHFFRHGGLHPVTPIWVCNRIYIFISYKFSPTTMTSLFGATLPWDTPPWRWCYINFNHLAPPSRKQILQRFTLRIVLSSFLWLWVVIMHFAFGALPILFKASHIKVLLPVLMWDVLSVQGSYSALLWLHYLAMSLYPFLLCFPGRWRKIPERQKEESQDSIM